MTTKNIRPFALILALLLGTVVIQAQTRSRKNRPAHRAPVSSSSETAVPNKAETGEIVGQRLILSNGRILEADQVWKQGTVVWYTRGGLTQSLDLELNKIEPVYAPRPKDQPTTSPKPSAPVAPPEKSVWIHLVGGARFKVDDVNETADGTWYHRGNVSAFLDAARIERIERDESGPSQGGSRNRDWTSGSAYIDQLIREHANRVRLDPYLVFLVIEQESQFHVRAVSPKGAKGLMQLMPGTARRFGVFRPFDAAENIRGGTRYLRELMDMFGGEINLVLASYNAGEGAVMRYGRNVPPYRETRDYVRKIGKRYGLNGRQPSDDDSISPQ
jgi:transglycosylase-like protein with SLT domain